MSISPLTVLPPCNDGRPLGSRKQTLAAGERYSILQSIFSDHECRAIATHVAKY
jgi:hypothetical protein